jgi:hypothetical protein
MWDVFAWIHGNTLPFAHMCRLFDKNHRGVDKKFLKSKILERFIVDWGSDDSIVISEMPVRDILDLVINPSISMRKKFTLIGDIFDYFEENGFSVANFKRCSDGLFVSLRLPVNI